MSPTGQRQLYTGIALLICGFWTLSLLDSAGKTLMLMGFHVILISWARYLGHSVVLLAMFGPRHGRRLFATTAPGLQILRAIVMLATTMLFFTSLRYLPLAEATAINFTAPLWVVILAPFVLRETASGARWIGVAIGFCGMLIVVRPGSQLPAIGVAICLVNAFCNAWFQILTRKLAGRDDPLVTLVYSGVVGVALTSLALPWFWPHEALTLGQWAIFLSTGLSGALGHYLVILAFRRTPASILSPFMYLQIVSATALGMLIFGQHPDAWSALGIAIICGGGVFLAVSERNRLAARP